LQDLANGLETERQAYYNKFLFSDSDRSPLKVKPVEAKYSKDSPTLMGFEVLNKAFDEILAREPLMVAFGEDVGQLGDVNQAFRGLQEKYGPLRVLIQVFVKLPFWAGYWSRSARLPPDCRNSVSRLPALRAPNHGG